MVHSQQRFDWSPRLTKIIPEKLAKHHGGANAASIGANWAETFEIHGGLSRESVVLDIGCGPGRMAVGIGERFDFRQPSYLGFDITKPDIDWCQKNITAAHPNFRFVHLDVKNAHYNPQGKIEPYDVQFPASTGSSDFIFATSVFTHMRTLELEVYLAESKRCLSKDGRIFATFFCLEEGFAGRMPEGRDFSTRIDAQCYTARPENPEDAIAYDKAYVLNSFEKLGLKADFFRGGWSGLATRNGRHGQDYVVARHAR